ncbi:MAG: hypothetical protein HDR12_06330 [Lachnospiraceae bacterium]|nr:hypothetical protein [Lachnospiraceae bacterium]
MKTLIISVVFLIFLFIFVKNKLEKIGIIGKKKPDKDSSEKNKDAQVVPVSDNNSLLDGYTRHDVHVFDYSKCESETYFAGLIDAKLSIVEAEMQEKGYPYSIKYLVLNNAIVCIVEYKINSNRVSLKEVKA